MTDKELSRLGRGDLIEIIYKLKKNEDKLKLQLVHANDELEQADKEIERLTNEIEQADREIERLSKTQGVPDSVSVGETVKYTKVGSIAEAALSMNGVFEAAQKAADDYLMLIHSNYSDIETRCSKMLSETEAKCAQLERDTDIKINAKWALFNKKVNEYLQAKNEISELLK